MTIELAERLKSELTDKYVVVADDVPELRRFSGLTGTVKTVNMNGRALVQFNGPEDISWYDIDPNYLRVVDAPLPRRAEAKAAAPQEVKAKASPTPKAPAGKSPLELARQQGAVGAATPATGGSQKKLSPLELARQQGAAGAASGPAAHPAKAAPSAEGGKKLSPLELARQQGAAGASSGSAAAPTKAAPTAEPGKKLSPIELARQQGAAKAATAATSAAKTDEVVEAPKSAPVAAPAKQAPAADTSGLSKIELARRQGAAKRD